MFPLSGMRERMSGMRVLSGILEWDEGTGGGVVVVMGGIMGDWLVDWRNG